MGIRTEETAPSGQLTDDTEVVPPTRSAAGMEGPARLSIVACLSVVEEVDFVFLQSQTGMTGGNLSSHIKKLEEKAYISVKKEFQDGKPRTSFRLTEAGRNGFRKYLRATRNLLKELGEI